MYQKDAFSVDGYIKLKYLSMYIDGYSETEIDLSGSTATPGLALTYLGQDVNSTGAAAGVTLRWDIGTSFGVVAPYLGDEVRYCGTAVPKIWITRIPTRYST